MGKNVRIQVMTPEFVKKVDPRFIGEAVQRLIEGPETPFGVVLIGSREEAAKFTELNLWQFAPPVLVERD